ncbi:HEAT repeat domain-containing protein [Paractinoplanes lichenicola]|uniref:HEAT repeat domain-containing protein n=1 Tax=Paractinoplanes lichenicola TaxID=2802976 RepID=A0ABS1W0C5_9ACTN|nr:hypothetical protein [Actinoplanes lichenicola]MBL7260013.1 hypothetical protein [Actinoplanes lichenicola]
MYDDPRTTLGALQRGLGRGTFEATGEQVLQCLAVDYRWDRDVDDRAVYLARLVRKARVPVRSVVELFRARPDDDDNALDVLVALGRGGDPEAIEALRKYVADGPRWVGVLEQIAYDWPRDLWDDLRTVAESRLSGDVVRIGAPWTLWGMADETIAPAPRPRRERPADPALPTARDWAATPGHPMRWRAQRVLAEHGDETDVPALIEAWDWLDSRPEDLCGYDEIATGLARLGAREVLPRLRELWFSPHSYERASYLRAERILDPERVRPRLVEGLWDCEADVRELAAEHAPLEPRVVERLAELKDDPMEDERVRDAARLRGV